MKRILTLAFCAVLLPMMLVAQDVQITPFDNNTDSDDFAPAPTNHGRVVIMSSSRSGEQQLYSIERTSSGWSEPSKLKGDVNDGEQVGAAALTPDGQTMIFSAFQHDVEGQGRTDLYMATRQNGKWIDVTNLGSSVNSSAYDAQPTLSADGRTLYFVSDRANGKGGTDVYVSQWNGSSWSAARPLDGVNTAANEMSPVIAADGRTLTFASDRSGGSGGYDIYVAKIDGMNVSGVKSAGAPINTGADELFYASIPNSNQAYFTRMNASGDYDNFLAVPNPFPSEPVTLIEGVVSDAISKEPLGSEMTVTDLTTGKAVAKLRSDDKSGAYFVTLTPGRVYSITAKRNGYLFHSERYDVPPTAKGQTITKDIALSPINGGGGRLLVFFDYDKAELKSESYPELERVIELLRDNPNMKMVFEGHTDDQGDDSYNDGLSKRRAKAVLDYVVNGGIDAGRVSSEGYGEKRPLMEGTSDEARAMNRRVEMKVR